MVTRATRRLLFAALGSGLALVLAACSSSSNPPATTTTSTTAAPSTSTSTSAAAASTTTSTSSGTTVTSGTLLPETATGTEFYSPSRNISCEIDAGAGSNPGTSTLCLTINPARSVVLSADGTLKECTTGQNCLSNAGVNTPTLAYGQSITLGPFTCVSSTAGMMCTIASGAGFLIASAGITPLGSATVTSS
jgi:hypothetical protein